MSTMPDLTHALVNARICDLRTDAARRRRAPHRPLLHCVLPGLRRAGATYLRWMEHGHLGLIPPATR